MPANKPRRWSLSRLTARVARSVPVLITLILAGIGAAAGFRHTHDWAEHNGQHGWFAWADAVVIECLCLVAGFEIHRFRQAGRNPRLPVAVLVIGFLVQMTAQVADATRTPAGWLLAATPALGFLVVVKMVMNRLQATDHVDAATATADEDAGRAEAPAPPPTSQASPTPPTPPTAPTAPTAVLPVAPEPEPRPAPPVTIPRVRLPQPLIDQITALVERIRAEGREPTTEDVRRAVKVPEAMAGQILAGLPAPTPPVNGHRVA